MRQYVYSCASNQKAYFIYGHYVYRLATSQPEYRISNNRWSPMADQEPMTVRHGLVFKESDLQNPIYFVGAQRGKGTDPVSGEDIVDVQGDGATFPFPFPHG